MPRVLLPAAEPPYDAALAPVVEELLSEEYIYLLRAFDPKHPGEAPRANIPHVELPTAAPPNCVALDEAALVLVSQA